MTTTHMATSYQVITDRILALLEQGMVPWQQPWDSATGVPRNLFSQRPYRGINVWLLTRSSTPWPPGWPRPSEGQFFGQGDGEHFVSWCDKTKWGAFRPDFCG